MYSVPSGAAATIGSFPCVPTVTGVMLLPIARLAGATTIRMIAPIQPARRSKVVNTTILLHPVGDSSYRHVPQPCSAVQASCRGEATAYPGDGRARGPRIGAACMRKGPGG